MRIAILDLGTNTFHLLIVEVTGKKNTQIYKAKIAVKLGEGAIHRNRIGKIPFSRGIQTLSHYKEIIDKHKPDKIFAFATSAIRSSVNGKFFISEVKKKTGISVKIISGAREAELIYFGVRQCVNLKGQPALIMDIGGGSTEFIIADDKKVYWKKSFNIGAARLLEYFHPSDPANLNDVKKIQTFLEHQLSPLRKAIKKYPVTKLIGSSGSFDTFAEMIGYRYHKKSVLQTANTYKFNLNEFYKLHDVILHSNKAQRIKMRGLIPMRVDMIVIASICTEFILKTFEIKEMHLSKYALKEGALWAVTSEF